MPKTKTAANAILYYEAGQSLVGMAALTDSGDHTTFTSPDTLWSGYEGKEPEVRPNGLVSGGVITPAASGSNDVVDVSAGTAYIAGVLTEISAATDLAITRAVTTDTHMINSIVIQSGSYAVTTGTDSTAFSSTRDADGGPPLIGVNDIEVGQVRTASNSAAAIASSEIFQVPGTHQERSDYPIWDEDWVLGQITFSSALPAIHTGPVPKKVYAEYSTPTFSEVPNPSDFVPAENSHSVTSTDIYGGSVGAVSSSLGQGSFTTRLLTGVNDHILRFIDYTLWFKFLPDRYRSEYVLTQGKLGASRTFPPGDHIQAACTISASTKSVNKDA